MKLVFYEFKKVLNKRMFWIVLALCLVFNCFLFYAAQNTDDNGQRLTYSDEYINLLDRYSAMPTEEAEAEIKNELLVYEIADNIEYALYADTQEEIDECARLLDEYKAANPQTYEKAVNLTESSEERLWKTTFLYDIEQKLEYIADYPSFIDEMRTRADEQSQVSVFADEDSFSYKNLYKTAEDYAHLKDTSLSVINSEPLTSVADFHLTDAFTIVAVLLLCVYLFGYERDKGLLPLVKSTSHGRLKTIFAKLCVLVVLTAAICALFFAANFTTAQVMYGTVDFGASVQSVSAFRNCTLSVNIFGFLLLLALSKFIASAVLALILAFLFTAFSSSALACLVWAGVTGGEYLLYSFVNVSSSFGLLKYINIFYIFDGAGFFGTYQNLNILSNAVTALPTVLLIFAVISIVCAVLACRFFCVRMSGKRSGILSSVSEKIRKRLGKVSGSTSIFTGEVFKFFVQNKMALLLLALVLYAVVSSFGTVRYPYSEATDAEYKTYMEYLEGDITAEKEDYIAAEQQYFDSLNAKLEQTNENPNLSDSAKQAVTRSIDNILSTKGAAFDRVTEQYSRLRELKENGINARFIDENVYSVFVSNPSREWTSALLLFVILAGSLPFVFTVEYKNNMINLLRPTENGKLRLFFSKMSMSLLYVFICFLAVYLPYYIRFFTTYGTQSLQTPIACVFEGASDSSLTVLGSAAVYLLCSFLMTAAVSAVIGLVSIVLKSAMTSAAVSAALVIVPTLAIYSAQNIRICFFTANANSSVLVILCCFCLVLAAVLTVFSAKMFTTNSLKNFIPHRRKHYAQA